MGNSVNQHLIDLYQQHGQLTPELVVADARSKDSPLHDLFEWDVQKASELHWHDTARALIRNVRVTVVHEERVLAAPYFVRNPSLPNAQQGYVSVQRLRSNADLARQAVMAECDRAIAAFKRAQNVAAAVGLADELDDLVLATRTFTSRLQAEGKVAAN